jgi:alkylation response protein AidB-like acyl-CoA dehydrogenase
MDAQMTKETLSQLRISDYMDMIEEIGPEFATRAAARNDSDEFVSDNFADLRERKFFSAMVPHELGGGGVAHSEMCTIIRKIAHYCPSTALTLSMHQHLIAANRYNYHNGNPGQALLEKVVADELILVSTGASDWLNSSGEMTKVEGGYLVNAKKGFASGSVAGHIFIMSSCYNDPKEGWQVLHFPIPKSAEGVSIEENWQAMGMRNTGSHMAVFEDVFVPEEAIGLKRPRGEYHPVWNVILTVAMPLIMSAYVGIAEAAADIVRDSAQKRSKNHKLDGHLPYLFGEMENSLITAQVMHKNMVAITNDFEFTPSTKMASDILAHKTVVANAVTDTTTKAIEASGGFGYLRVTPIERFFRDSFASQFHPLHEKKQHSFTGRLSMGLEPVEVPEFD